MAVFEAPPSSGLETRVAQVEGILAALGLRLDGEVEARDEALALLSGERVAGDAASVDRDNAEQVARDLRVQSVANGLADEIALRAEQFQYLDEKTSNLGEVSAELAAAEGRAAGTIAGRTAALLAVYGTGYTFPDTKLVDHLAQRVLTRDAARVQLRLRVLTYAGEVIVNTKERQPSRYDPESFTLSYFDEARVFTGADCPLGDIWIASLTGEVEVEVTITNTTGYDPATAAMLARFAVQPTEARYPIIAARYSAHSAADIMGSADASFMFAAADQQAGLVNWAAPSTSQLVGTVPFLPDRHFVGGAGHIRSGVLLPSAKYSINNASMFLWISDTLLQNNTFTMGWGAGAIQPNRSAANGGSVWVRPNVNSNILGTTGGVGGFFGWTRDNPDTAKLYWYNALTDVLTVREFLAQAETAFQRELLFLCNNGALGANSLCSHNLMAGWAGTFLTETQVETMLRSDLTYLRAVGAR